MTKIFDVERLNSALTKAGADAMREPDANDVVTVRRGMLNGLAGAMGSITKELTQQFSAALEQRDERIRGLVARVYALEQKP